MFDPTGFPGGGGGGGYTCNDAQIPHILSAMVGRLDLDRVAVTTFNDDRLSMRLG